MPDVIETNPAPVTDVEANAFRTCQLDFSCKATTTDLAHVKKTVQYFNTSLQFSVEFIKYADASVIGNVVKQNLHKLEKHIKSYQDRLK